MDLKAFFFSLRAVKERERARETTIDLKGERLRFIIAKWVSICKMFLSIKVKLKYEIFRQ